MSDHALDRLLDTLDPGTHVIEASAGTGKTWTITSLVAAALALGTVAPSRILTVTFTRAATAELRVRVRERIAELAALLADEQTHDPFTLALLARAGGPAARATLQTRLAQALAESDAIGVDTMHGWCATLLGQYGDLLGLDVPAEDRTSSSPPLAELTERGALIASMKVNDALWQGFATRGASADGLHQVAAALLAGVSRVRVVSADGTMLDETALVERFESISIRVMTLFNNLSDDWAEHGDRYLETLRSAIQTKQIKSWRTDWLEARARTVNTLLSGFPELLGADEKAISQLARFGTTALAECACKGQPPTSLGLFSDQVEQLCALLPGFSATLAVPLRHFVNAVTDALPSQANDFDDLLRLVASGLLRDPLVAERVRRSADLVLIDESQDTDPMQWRIFSTLFHGESYGKRLVLVGDPKQSIYRFRNAEVAVYLAARTAASTEPHSLDTNYRSDPALVEAVNAVYASAPDVFGDDVVFAPVMAHRTRPELQRGVAFRAKAGSGEVEKPFCFVRVPADVVSDGSGIQALRDEVAHDVARRIASILGAADHDALYLTRHGGDTKRVQARDCAVLVSSNQQARQIVQALRAAGVHAVAATRDPVTQSASAGEVHSLLRAMESPDDRALLRAAALSALVRPALGLTPSSPPRAMLEALDGEPGRQLHDAVRRASPRWSTRGVMDAWIAIDRELGLSRLMANAPDAERRLTDVRHLLELLATYESRTHSAPPQALRWLQERMQEQRPDQTLADELEERLESDEEAVRVLTTHASKGLEFPLVWVPFAWVSRAQRSPTVHQPLVRRYNAEHEDIEGVVPAGDGKRADNPVVRAEHDALRLEQQRLLYVALTRARNGCTVYVGENTNAARSPLTELLGGDLKTAWTTVESLAAAAAGGIRAEVLSANGTTRPLSAAGAAVRGTLTAALWTRSQAFDMSWRRGSFTALTSSRGAGHAAASLHDGATDASAGWSADPALDVAVSEAMYELSEEERVVGGLRDPAADEGDDNVLAIAAAGAFADEAQLRSPLASFPRGRAAGNALHDVLERAMHADITADALSVTVPEALSRHGLDAARWGRVLEPALLRAIDVPLAGLKDPAPTLRTLAQAQIFTELTFDFAVSSDNGWEAGELLDGGTGAALRSVSSRALARVFSDHPGGLISADYAARVAALDFVPLRGMLTGAIDLVARLDGQWVIVDYKSNYLGDVLNNYDAPQLAHSMQSHHYVLQYHLYLVALHRYLRLRQTGYDYNHHVLGAAYLFVRGMDKRFPGGGVFVDRPPKARIEALDMLLRTGDVQ